MKNKIRLLDSSTINKIAAGEVIERPASVVKELIENSIDAMSTFITIEIENGGKKYIRVTDNGTGIDSENIELAFLRHSTSKINKAEDLQSLTTLGFRGEALASISSISQLELITRTKDSITGTHLFINGGSIIDKKEVGCPVGTTIILRNLFFNVPVRQKFLKSDTVESSHISDIVNKLALGNPNIKFKYIKDSKVVLNTPGKNDINSTVYSLFGKEFSKSMFEFNYSGDDIKLFGLISKPSFTRGNRFHQYLYVNGRYVKNDEVTEIIEESYKTLIPNNRFPIYIIYLNIRPELIDVNVHPTKTEIRFANRDILKAALAEAIHKVFTKNSLIPQVEITSNKKEYFEENTSKKQESFLDFADYGNNHHNDNEVLNKISEFGIDDEKDTEHKIELELRDNRENKIIENTADIDDIIRIVEYNSIEGDLNKVYEHEEELIKKSNIPELKIIGVLFDNYILGEDKYRNELYIIDQHAAHERIMYEEIKRQLESNEIYKQQLIAPHILNITHSEMDLVKENHKLFKDLGFDIEEFGYNSIAIRSVPLVFGLPDNNNLFLDLLDNLKNEVNTNYDIRLEKVMKLACSSAIKSGHHIKEIEIDSLLKDLRKTKQPYTCPHGRPTIIKVTKYELEKRFKRV